jgi:ribosome-binding protein aMBF1 (putative translation factor)
MIVLTRERRARGWSISELARRSVMANGDVGKIEAGRLQPYPTQLRKLARALGWRLDDAQRLLDTAESPETATAK